MASHRASGRIGQSGRLLTPYALSAARIALERNTGLRVRRLVAAGADHARQQLRPSRSRMRTLMAAPGGRLTWRAAPAPEAPGPDGALVHPIAIATCDLDRALVLGATPFPLPLHLGHECVAEVIEVGDRVTSVRRGARVIVPFQISCGDCRKCRSGFTGNCSRVPPASMYGFGLLGGHWGGALSDQLYVPYADAMLVPLPDSLGSAAAASVADNVSDGYRHIGPYLPGLLDDDADVDVLIIAALTKRSLYSPSVGLYAGLIAQVLGARTVHFVDARHHVRAHADHLGMRSMAPHELRGLPLAPLVVEASATPRGLHTALSKTAPDGICSSVGALYRSARIPAGLLYGRNASLHIARSHARAVIPRVLELMAGGRLQPERVTTCLAPLDDAPRALKEHFMGDGIKTVLVADNAV